jgi:hypothetical protein
VAVNVDPTRLATLLEFADRIGGGRATRLYQCFRFFLSCSAKSSPRKLTTKMTRADAQKKIGTACLSMSPPDLSFRQVTYFLAYTECV